MLEDPPEHADVDPYMLAAAYEKLAVLHDEKQQGAEAKQARRNASQILRAKSETRPALVFNFYIDWLKEQSERDEEAISAAYLRLADIEQRMGLHRRLTPRQQHWQIIDQLEAQRADPAQLAAAYNKLGDLCGRIGDSNGARQARESASVVLMGSPVERQEFLIDQMEESDDVDLRALASAYAELSVYRSEDGDEEGAAASQDCSQAISLAWQESGEPTRTPRSVWRSDKRLTPRAKESSRQSRYSPRDPNASSRLNTHRSLRSQYTCSDGGYTDDDSQGGGHDGEFEDDASAQSHPKVGMLPIISMKQGASGRIRDTVLVERSAYLEDKSHKRSKALVLGGDMDDNYSLDGSLVSGTEVGSQELLAGSPFKRHNAITPSPFKKGGQQSVSPQLHGAVGVVGAEGSMLSIDSNMTTQNVVTMDCTHRAMHKLEDCLLEMQVKLVKLKAEFKGIEKVKGFCNITLVYSTGAITLDFKWRYALLFRVLYDNRIFEGKLHFSHMTKATIFNTRAPFPIEFSWKDGRSPTGLDYNQVTAILTSSRMRANIREAYIAFEEKVVDDYMPKFQQQRRGAAYKNLEGKKGAIFNLAQSASALQDSGLFDGIFGASEENRSSLLDEAFNATKSSTAEDGDHSRSGTGVMVRGMMVEDPTKAGTPIQLNRGSSKVRTPSSKSSSIAGLGGSSYRMSRAVGKGEDYRSSEVLKD